MTTIYVLAFALFLLGFGVFVFLLVGGIALSAAERSEHEAHERGLRSGNLR